MANKKILYETGSKKVYESDLDNKLTMTFSDSFINSDGSVGGKIKRKAEICNSVTCQVFEILESYNIMTHFSAKITDKEMEIKNSIPLPIKVVISNLAGKNLSKRFGIENGTVLNGPIIEYYYLNERLKDPLVNESHIHALNLITQEEVHHLGRTASKANAVLKSFFERRMLYLAELNLSIGRYKGNLLIIDEISPETCKFLGVDNEGNIDKNSYNLEKGNVDEIYQNIYNLIVVGG